MKAMLQSVEADDLCRQSQQAMTGPAASDVLANANIAETLTQLTALWSGAQYITAARVQVIYFFIFLL